MGDGLAARVRLGVAAWTAQLHGHSILAAQIRSGDRDVREIALARLSAIMRAPAYDRPVQLEPVSDRKDMTPTAPTLTAGPEAA